MLGKIGNVIIRDEGQRKTVWFEGQNHIRSISLKELRKRGFKMGSILRENGFNVEDVMVFDNLLLHLSYSRKHYCAGCQQVTNHNVFVFANDKTVCSDCGKEL